VYGHDGLPRYGIVTPIFKSGSKQDIDNYRPVSVLPTCSKIFEKVVHQQVSDYLEGKGVAIVYTVRLSKEAEH